MRSDVIIIASIGSQDPAQMRLAQNDKMIHTLAPHRSDQPFGKAILPGRAWGRRSVPDAHGANSAHDDAAINPIPIPDEVARRLIPGECLGQLTCDPFSRWVCCDVDPDQVSAAQTDDDEGIKQVEANSWNNEQIHGSNVRRVVPQKGAPSLTWRSTPLDHVLGDARLRDFKPELEQFTVNTRRSPKRILHAHLPNQCAEVRLDLRPPSPRARLPTPITAKADPMPTHERLRLDDREDRQNRRKPAIQLDKKPAVVVRQPDSAPHLAP